MKDIVIGTAHNLKYDYIEMWCNSLDQSGFDGIKVLVATNMDFNILYRLSDRGYHVFDNLNGLTEHGSVYVNRFYHYWYLLKHVIPIMNDIKPRYVIATDVSDVIFQSNPSVGLEENIGEDRILASSEAVQYMHEPWNRENMINSFGEHVYNLHKKNIVLNAGVIAGECEFIADLFLKIYLMCSFAPSIVRGGGGPDQAAYNILLSSSVYSDKLKVSTSYDTWAAQLGTISPQKRSVYGDNIHEPEPTFIDDVVCTYDGKPYTIVHQYNRIPEWNSVIHKFSKGK
jgi:hypothetical protein